LLDEAVVATDLADATDRPEGGGGIANDAEPEAERGGGTSFAFAVTLFLFEALNFGVAFAFGAAAEVAVADFFEVSAFLPFVEDLVEAADAAEGGGGGSMGGGILTSEVTAARLSSSAFSSAKLLSSCTALEVDASGDGPDGVGVGIAKIHVC
jgi:hypothetical protein